MRLSESAKDRVALWIVIIACVGAYVAVGLVGLALCGWPGPVALVSFTVAISAVAWACVRLDQKETRLQREEA